MPHPADVVDYGGLEFMQGYEHGYLGGQPVSGSASCREGWITGEAERDAPREFVRSDLYDRRHRTGDHGSADPGFTLPGG